MSYHNETEIRNLPDTPLNRRLLKRWNEQDQRGLLLQRTLFSEHFEADPFTPEKEPERGCNETAGVTFKIQQENSEHEEIVDQTAVDRAIVSRMISGSSRSRAFSASEISQSVLSSINIQTEFPKVYELKKNKCASVTSFVQWLIKHESFKWPVDEKGDALRDVLSQLAVNLMAESLAPPKLVAAIQLASLFVSEHHKRVFISDSVPLWALPLRTRIQQIHG